MFNFWLCPRKTLNVSITFYKMRHHLLKSCGRFLQICEFKWSTPCLLTCVGDCLRFCSSTFACCTRQSRALNIWSASFGFAWKKEEGEAMNNLVLHLNDACIPIWELLHCLLLILCCMIDFDLFVWKFYILFHLIGYISIPLPDYH